MLTNVTLGSDGRGHSCRNCCFGTEYSRSLHSGDPVCCLELSIIVTEQNWGVSKKLGSFQNQNSGVSKKLGSFKNQNSSFQNQNSSLFLAHVSGSKMGILVVMPPISITIACIKLFSITYVPNSFDLAIITVYVCG